MERNPPKTKGLINFCDVRLVYYLQTILLLQNYHYITKYNNTYAFLFEDQTVTVNGGIIMLLQEFQATSLHVARLREKAWVKCVKSLPCFTE